MIIFLNENLINNENEKKLLKYFVIKKNNNLKKKDHKKVYAIFVKLNKKIKLSYLKKFPNLRFILSPTTGLNHLDENILNDSKLRIISLNRFKKEINNILSTSEYSLTLILSAARRLLEQSYFSKKNSFNRYRYKTYQFKNQKVGIVGFGRIGKYVAKKLKYLGFKVIIHDPKQKNSKNVKFSSLKFLFKNSNIISFHLNYSKQNDNFFDKKIFVHCKKKPIIINTSRGEIINQNDLIKYILNGKISSAYLDVIKNEQNQFNSKKSKIFKLNKTEKLFILPHLGGSTVDAMFRTENLVINHFIKKYA